jgi:hypothetical protein
VVTLLNEEEKEAFQTLAWRSGLLMAAYFRYTLIDAIAILPELFF